MRVVLYTRVSSDEQASSGVSLDAQDARLRAYSALYDLEVVAVIQDAGESAKSLNRPGIQQALTMLRSGQADGLAVVKLDRLTRSVADWQSLVKDYFGEKGYALFSVGDQLDSRTAMGRLIINITLSVSQWEREACGERTKAALQHKISKGERCGKIRYGFDLHTDGRTLTPNSSEQASIALMRELRTAGRTLRAIACELSRRQIATKEGLPTWTHTAVAYILKQDRAAV